MARRRFPIGVQDFEKIREDGFVYIDKTEYVYDLANNYGDALFLNRPRRFGKSLLCSTLRHYFQGHKDLFEGLAIEKLEKEWTPYPVFHFDMSRCKHDNIQEIPEELGLMLSAFEKQFEYDGSDFAFGARLKQLIETAHAKTGNRVVLIFDEYDSPVLNVVDKPEKMNAVRSIFNSFYGPVKSMAEHLRFVFITGITKFSQMSIFSTINNLKNISMIEAMEGLCGITTDELETNFRQDIETMTGRYQCTYDEMLEKLRDRYDGYHFGADMIDVYNPFSLMNAFSDKLLDDYWFDSATPSALIKILQLYNFRFADLENTRLLKNAFDRPFDNMSSAVPILYQSGYLTIKDFTLDGEDAIFTLGIPNKEVYRGLYYTLMDNYLNPVMRDNQAFLLTVKEGIRDDDINKVLDAVKNYMSTISYELSNKTERDFETILKVIFDCLGIYSQVEVRNARGRCDVVIANRQTIYVLELKIDGSATVDDALAQIDEKDYLIPYLNDPRRKIKVGVIVDPEARTLKEWKVAE